MIETSSRQRRADDRSRRHSAGPLVLGDRRPPARGLAVIRLVAPAVLTALILYGTFAATPSGIALDEWALGLAAAVLALAARAPWSS